jgi:hypothetical protein
MGRPSASLVISCVSLFIAMGGTSYAVIHLPANSVNTRQIRNRAVNTAKLHANSVNGSRVRNGSLTNADLSAATRSRVFFTQMSDSDSYPLTTSATHHDSQVDLPAGNFALNGSVQVESDDLTTDSHVRCVIGTESPLPFAEGDVWVRHSDLVRVSPTSTLIIRGAVHLSSPTSVALTCTNLDEGMVGGDVVLAGRGFSATRAAAIHDFTPPPSP